MTKSSRDRPARSPSKVRPVVTESWQRSLAAGVDPTNNEPPNLVEPDRLAELRQVHPLAPYLPLMRDLLLGDDESATHLVAVSDAEGNLLWLEGPHHHLLSADGLGMTPGARWSEWGVGTNAIGTALHDQRPVAISFTEHLVHTHHSWACSASPIRDPGTGALLGVLDVSGPVQGPDKLLLVRSVARTVEEMLRSAQQRREEEVLQRLLTRGGLDPTRTALLGPNGHHVWGRGDLVLPATELTGPGEFVLPGGEAVEIEAAGEFWLVHGGDRSTKEGDQAIDLEFLGLRGPTATIDGHRREISLRRAEILFLLSESRGGMTADEVAYELYGDEGNPLTVRSEMHRIRQVLGERIASSPYRFVVPVDTDIRRVRRLLAAGQVQHAVAAYPGLLLPRSASLSIELRRAELHGALRRAVLRADLATVAAWCATPHGERDPEALSVLLRLLPATAPGRPVHEARLARILYEGRLPRA